MGEIVRVRIEAQDEASRVIDRFARESEKDFNTVEREGTDAFDEIGKAAVEAQRDLERATNRIGADARQLSFDFGRAADAMETEFDSAARAIGADAAKVGREFEMLDAEAKETATVFTDANGRMRDEFGRFVRDTTTGGTRVEDALDDIGDEARETEGILRRLARQALMSARNFGSMAGDINVTNRSLSSMLISATKLSAGLVGITTAAVAVGAAGREIVTFDSALRNVATLGPDIANQIGQFQEQILDLNPNLGSATELTEALYTALSAGAEPARAIELVAAGAKAATAGLTEANTAVNVATTVMAAFGDEAGNAERILDVMFQVVRDGKLTFDDLAQSFGDVAGTAAGLNVRFEDAASAVGIYARVTGNAQKATTGLRSFLAQLTQNAVKFREAGIDVNKTLDEQGLVGILRELQRVTGGNAESLREFVNDIEGVNFASAIMTGQMDELTEAQERARKASNTVGEAFDQQQKSLAASSKTIVNSLGRIVQRLVDVENTNVGEDLSDLAQGLSEVAKETPPAAGVLDNINQSLERMQRSIRGGIIDFFDRLADRGGNLQGALRGVSQHFRDLNNDSTDAINQVDENLENMGRRIGNTGDIAFRTFTGIVNEFGGMAAAGVESAQRIITETNNIRKNFSDMGLTATQAAQQMRSIRDRIVEDAPVIEEGFTGLTDSAMSFTDAVAETPDKVREIGEQANNLETEGASAFDEMGEKAQELQRRLVEVSGGVQGIGFETSKTTKRFNELDRSGTRIRDTVGEFGKRFKTAGEFAEGFGKNGEAAFVLVGNSAEQSAKDIDIAYKDALGRTQSTFENTVKSLGDNFDTIARDGKASSEFVVNAFLSDARGIIDFYDGIPDALRASFDRIARLAGVSTGEQLLAIRELGVKTKAEYEKMAREAEKNYRLMKESGVVSANDQLAVFVNDVIPGIIQAGERITPKYEREYRRLLESTRREANKLQIPFKDFVEQAGLTANDLPPKFRPAFEKLIEGGKRAGSGLGKGLSDGVREGADDALEKLDTVERALRDIDRRAREMNERIIDVNDPQFGAGGFSTADIDSLSESELERFIADRQRELANLDQSRAEGVAQAEFLRDRIRQAEERLRDLEQQSQDTDAALEDTFGSDRQDDIDSTADSIDRVTESTSAAAGAANDAANAFDRLNETIDVTFLPRPAQNTGSSSSGPSGAEDTFGDPDRGTDEGTLEETLDRLGIENIDVTTNTGNASGILLDEDDVFIQPESDDTSIVLGGFQNGGRVQQDGLFNLERGEVVLSRMVADSIRRGFQSSQQGVSDFVGRGNTDVGALGVQTTSGSRRSEGDDSDALLRGISRLSAQGQLSDLMGPTSERTLRKAVIPVTRIALSRRDLQRDIQNSTALTRRGEATVK